MECLGGSRQEVGVVLKWGVCFRQYRPDTGGPGVRQEEPLYLQTPENECGGTGLALKCVRRREGGRRGRGVRDRNHLGGEFKSGIILALVGTPKLTGRGPAS